MDLNKIWQISNNQESMARNEAMDEQSIGGRLYRVMARPSGT